MAVPVRPLDQSASQLSNPDPESRRSRGPGPRSFLDVPLGNLGKAHFYMVVVRGNGITAVINTGPPSDLSALNTAWHNFAGERCCLKRAPEEQPIQALAKAGVNPEDVDYVLLTRCKRTATANIALFPKARICLSKRGWVEDIMARPDYLHIPRQLCIPDETLHYLLFPAWERVSLLEDEDEICPVFARGGPGPIIAVRWFMSLRPKPAP